MLGSFYLFSLLALFGCCAESATLSNSTRLTYGRLWKMADNLNNVHYKLFTKLKAYALDCCTNNVYGKGHTLKTCQKKQVAFWAFVDKRLWDNQLGQLGDLMDYLEIYFNPAAQENAAAAVNICKGTGQDNSVFPMYAEVMRTAGNLDEGHTEAQLLRKMQFQANIQLGYGRPTHFFLYTFNSPCGATFCENCQKKIFDFTYDYIYNNYLPYHSLAVGLYQWWTPNDEQIQAVRSEFCRSVTMYKNLEKYDRVDFFTGLFFKKFLNEPGDTTYKPGTGNC